MEIKVQDWSRLDKDTFKFYFDQTEKRFKATLDVSDKITNRAFSILVGLLPLITVLVTLITQYYFPLSDKHPPIELVRACWFALVLAFTVLALLVKVIIPRMMYQMGSEPKNIATPNFFETPGFEKEKGYILNLINVIEHYQGYIEHMDEQNSERTRLVKIAIAIIASGLFLFSLSLILFAALSAGEHPAP